jgi:hypothetical protein
MKFLAYSRWMHPNQFHYVCIIWFQISTKENGWISIPSVSMKNIVLNLVTLYVSKLKVVLAF